MFRRYEVFAGNYCGGRSEYFFFRRSADRAFDAARAPEVYLSRVSGGRHVALRTRVPDGLPVVNIETGQFMGYQSEVG